MEPKEIHDDMTLEQIEAVGDALSDAALPLVANWARGWCCLAGTPFMAINSDVAAAYAKSVALGGPRELITHDVATVLMHRVCQAWQLGAVTIDELKQFAARSDFDWWTSYCAFETVAMTFARKNGAAK